MDKGNGLMRGRRAAVGDDEVGALERATRSPGRGEHAKPLDAVSGVAGETERPMRAAGPPDTEIKAGARPAEQNATDD